MKKTNDKKEYRRAQAVLEKSEGKTHKAIAKEHGVDERTTQRWIAAYIKKGIEGLQICRSSRHNKESGLIVIGTRGRSGFKRLLLGSVASHVVTYAHCPVFVAK